MLEDILESYVSILNLNYRYVSEDRNPDSCQYHDGVHTGMMYALGIIQYTGYEIAYDSKANRFYLVKRVN